MSELRLRAPTVGISGNISPQVYDRWKRSGMKFANVFSMGMNAVEQTPGYIDRVRELEEGNIKLQKYVTTLYAQNHEMQRRLGELEKPPFESVGG